MAYLYTFVALGLLLYCHQAQNVCICSQGLLDSVVVVQVTCSLLAPGVAVGWARQCPAAESGMSGSLKLWLHDRLPQALCASTCMEGQVSGHVSQL